MNAQLSKFLLSRFTICFTLRKLVHFPRQISFDMAIRLLQLGQFCCERFFICSPVERTHAQTLHTKLERWTYSRGPAKGEGEGSGRRGVLCPFSGFQNLSGPEEKAMSLLVFDYCFRTFPLRCCNFNTSLCHLSPFQSE